MNQHSFSAVAFHDTDTEDREREMLTGKEVVHAGGKRQGDYPQTGVHNLGRHGPRHRASETAVRNNVEEIKGQKCFGGFGGVRCDRRSQCWPDHRYGRSSRPYEKHGATVPDLICAVETNYDTDELYRHGVDSYPEDVIHTGLLIEVRLVPTLDKSKMLMRFGE